MPNYSASIHTSRMDILFVQTTCGFLKTQGYEIILKLTRRKFQKCDFFANILKIITIQRIFPASNLPRGSDHWQQKTG
jgi:hypothetical protein